MAKTDRIDAELIARFMAFRPDAGRRLPRGKLRDLRTLTAKRKQLVEMRKSAQQQTKANLKNGTAGQVEDLTEELLDLLERQIAEVEERVKSLVANDAVLSETAALLRSVPGIGPAVCAMPVAEMPELGQITGEQAAALAGLAPIARDSGRMRGKRMIGGGRRTLRQVLYQAALVASYRNMDLKVFADRLRKEGKPHKVVGVRGACGKIVVNPCPDPRIGRTLNQRSLQTGGRNHILINKSGRIGPGARIRTDLRQPLPMPVQSTSPGFPNLIFDYPEIQLLSQHLMAR